MSDVTGWAASSERGLATKEANHRFANHLALLAGYVRVRAADLAQQSAAPNLAEVQLLLESLHSQIIATSRLHRTLTLNSDSSRVDVKGYLHALCSSFGTLLEGRIAMIEDIPPGCTVGSDRILSLTQIVSELVTNAAKHAYAEGKSGSILVRGNCDPAGSVVIEVADNGPGLPDGLDLGKSSGLGLELIRTLLGRLGARVEFDSSPAGLSVRLIVPAGTEERTPDAFRRP